LRLGLGENLHNGYIKLWRKSFDSVVFASPELWKLWCLCLLKATHKKIYLDVDGIIKPVELLPGQFLTGRFELHKDYYPKKKKTNKSPKTLWRWIETLEKLENLTINSYNKYSIITILNWGEYQQSDQQMTNRCPTDDQQMTTNKNVKNVKNKTFEAFASFWKLYPKKKNKGQAEKAWNKIKIENGMLETIISAVERAKKTNDWLKNNGQYIPYPASWLNAKGWEDEYEEDNGRWE
jgi:hypothetical protein